MLVFSPIGKKIMFLVYVFLRVKIIKMNHSTFAQVVICNIFSLISAPVRSLNPLI